VAVKSWHDLRVALSKDRAALLQFVCATTSYRPLPHQIRAHLAGTNDPDGISYKLVLGGIGSGKSYWGVMEDLMMAIANPGKITLVMAPTYDQVLHILTPQFREMADQMAQAGYPLVRRYKHSQGSAELVCGGRTLWRSFCRVDSVRGFTISAAHLDESEQDMRPGYVFDVVAGRIRDPDAHLRQLHVTTTPRGMRGVVKKFVNMRRDAETMSVEDASAHRRQWWVMRAPTQSNTYLPEGWLDSIKAGYSKRQWEQEVEAQILRSDAAIYSEFSREAHVVPYEFDPLLPWDLAMDFGDQRPHYLAIQRLPDGQAVIFDEFCADDWPLEHKNKWVLDLVAQCGREPEHMAGDRARRDRIGWVQRNLKGTWCHKMKTRQEQLVTMGLEVVRSMLDPLEGPPRLYFSSRLLEGDRPRGIVRCMENYARRVRSDGVILDEPRKDGLFDNGADALRYWAVAVGDDSRKAYVMGRHARVKKGLANKYNRGR